MAYKRSNGKLRKRKIEPAVMNLSFTVRGIGTNYIDLSRAASIVNRRFYRQGINWSVAGFTVTASGTTAPGSVTVCKAPTTWVTYNAWVKSKAMWDRMNDQILDSEPSIEGRYADFKVFLNTAMKDSTLQAGTVPDDGAILQPTNCGYDFPQSNGSEWNYSTVQIPNDGGAVPPTENKLHIVGADDTTPGAESRGLIHGYGVSRARPINTGDPSVPGTGGWMQELFDLGDNFEEIRDDIAADNDRPPYPVGDSASGLEYYPGGATNMPGTEVVGYAVIGGSSTTGSVTSQRSIKGGMFPCGLIEVKSNLPGLSVSHYDLIVHLVPGNHRGYLCEPMEEV